MFRKFICFALAAVFALACVGCGKKTAEEPAPKTSPAPDSHRITYLNTQGTIAPLAMYPGSSRVAIAPSLTDAYKAANAVFAQTMLSAVQEGWTGVFSPISLQIAIELLADGSDDATASKLLDAVCPGMTREDVNTLTARFISDIAASNGVTINSAVVVSNAYMLAEKFAHDAADYYRASVGALDFSDPGAALAEINNWASQNTKGLVKNLLDQVGPDTAIVLLNALTVDLKWEEPFYALRELIEFKGSKTSSSVGAIGVSGNFDYGKFDEGQMVIVPYAGGEFAAALILPNEGADPIAAAKALIGKYDSCTGSDIIIKMPKLEINTSLDILNMANKLGLAEGLRGSFPNLINEGNVEITQVKQGSALILNENGTVAASATAIVGSKGVPMLTGDLEMIFDRPFALVIYHVPTGTAMYISIVNDI